MITASAGSDQPKSEQFTVMNHRGEATTFFYRRSFVPSSFERQRPAYRHSNRNATPTPNRISVHNRAELKYMMCTSTSREMKPRARNSGAVIPQWRVRFLIQLAIQPMAIANKIVSAAYARRGCQ